MAPVAAPADGADGASQSLDALRAAAGRGEVSAQLALGCRLLVGKGAEFAPEEGLKLVEAAARAGDAEAFSTLATLTGAGAWTQQSWPRAMELLCEAAIRGSRDAGAQLCLIAAGATRGVPPPPPDSADGWRRLAATIDLEGFVRPPERVQVCKSPRIWTAKGFASPAECAWLRARTDGKLKPAKMYDRVRQTSSFTAIRNNSDHFFDVLEGGVILVLMRVRISLLVSLPVPHFEPPQMLHYAPGQELRAHFDTLRENDAGYGKDGAYAGDRVVTFLLYLNEGYAGGETEFMKAGFRNKGGMGDGIFFANLKDGKTDRMSLHAGRPIVSGEKYLLSQWIHDRPFAAVRDF